MRVVFFGTPAFAVPALHALIRHGHEVVAVVSQPDRPRGRSRSRLIAPPIKTLALEEGLAVLQPDRPIGDVFATALQRLRPDVGIVVAYGHILRPEILTIPKRGMLNIHASLLPRWRGAAPVQAAVLEGDTLTGVSIMQMEEGLDSGPVLHQVETPIDPEESAGQLAARLADLGATALLATLDRLAARPIESVPQEEGAASYAPKVNRSMARIDWHEDGLRTARRVRAFDPAPGAWCQLPDGSDLKLFGAHPANGRAEPGTILDAGDTLLVATGAGAVAVDAVQPAGKRRMPVAQWLHGHRNLAGQRLT